MKTRLYLALLCSFFISLPLLSQNSLNGTIKDTASGKTLEGAVVYIPDLKVASQAGANGVYTVANLPKGTYLVEVHLLGYAVKAQPIHIEGATKHDFSITQNDVEENEVVITGTSSATDAAHSPQAIVNVSNEYLNENSATNVIDAIAKTPGVAAMSDGQSISKPFIRGLGYNRVLTVNDGVVQADQPWFDEFGIEIDPNSVERVEILKGPASLAYGSDALAGVINFIPEKPLPEGEKKGDILFNYQTNNGLINNMLHLAGTSNGISWSGRVDNIMAHSYQNPNDGYVINSQFSNFNTDGTVGIHRAWGYSQIHASYFDMRTGIVDGTRDSATGLMMRPVAYTGVNGGQPFYVIPTAAEARSYTPFLINQRIQHTKLVWDNSIAVGEGRISAVFSYQKNQRQENNDPTIPNISDIYYYSDAITYDLRYISKQMGGFNFSAGANGMNQNSQSLGSLMLIPNYNIFQVGGFVIANEHIGKLDLSGGVRYDTRTFTCVDHWVDSTQVPIAPNTPGGVHEFQGFTSNFSGMSGSFGAVYNVNKNFLVKANIARGYRAPNVSECAANGVHDGTIVWELGDNTLKPETSLQEDLSLVLNTKNFRLELNAFNNSISDFIYAQGLMSKVPGTGDSINNTFSNVGLGGAPVYKYTQGNARLYGGEAALDIHPAALPWVELDASVSMVSGGLLNVPDSVKVLPFVSPMRIIADLKFHIPKIGKGIKNIYVKVGILNCSQQNDIYRQYAIYNGLSSAQTPFQYAASQAATKGYTLVNAGVGGDILSHGHTLCKVFIAMTNLMDTPYIDYMSRFKYFPVNYTTGRVGVFNMGRNVSFKLIIPFDIRNK
ncbi:MAG TPA: TonB-dependent receptor [Bacteroidia bacterium]|jgi:iron complex outermembrane receptor protein|nr:TonB-dependent receptor [Bacteroidia bacterium]